MVKEGGAVGVFVTVGVLVNVGVIVGVLVGGTHGLVKRSARVLGSIAGLLFAPSEPTLQTSLALTAATPFNWSSSEEALGLPTIDQSFDPLCMMRVRLCWVTLSSE
jgi:hypothetical protein